MCLNPTAQDPLDILRGWIGQRILYGLVMLIHMITAEPGPDLAITILQYPDRILFTSRPSTLHNLFPLGVRDLLVAPDPGRIRRTARPDPAVIVFVYEAKPVDQSLGLHIEVQDNTNNRVNRYALTMVRYRWPFGNE